MRSHGFNKPFVLWTTYEWRSGEEGCPLPDWYVDILTDLYDEVDKNGDDDYWFSVRDLTWSMSEAFK
jgi:hypothetical protein